MKPRNIFILDDCVLRHDKFKTHLDGAQVTKAHTASEAYPLLRHGRFDVVFLEHDLEMSGPYCGSGTEVVTSIAVLARMSMYPSINAIHCIHSMNFERVEYMYKVLCEAGILTKRCALAWEEAPALETLAACGVWELPERWTGSLKFEDPV